MASSPTFTGKTASQSRDDQLLTLSNLLKQRGVAQPNINKGSDDYNWAQAVGNEVEGIYASLAVAGDQLMGDTAVDADLDRITAIDGVVRKGAGASTGKIVFATTLTTGVAAGAQLQDSNGNRYSVVTGGTFNNGDSIAIASVNVGSATNLPGGTTLTWVTLPTYAAPTAPLDALGMLGGVDSEDNDTLRKRWLEVRQSPPGSGNASQVAIAAEQSDASIQKCFVYPACNGPGTEHMAVAGYASASFTRSRQVSAAAVAAAASAISGVAPEYTERVCTAVVDWTANVTFQLLLPAATNAIPSGTGGGWIDPNPWPSVSGIDQTRIYCRATVVTNSTTMRVESMADPVVGESISWIDRGFFALHTAKIVTTSTAVSPSGTTPGTYDITIDTPFADASGAIIQVNDYVFPASVKGATYLQAVLDTFGAMGPYEKTTSPGLLPDAYRQPRHPASWPYALGGNFTRALVDAGTEVQDVAWGYQNVATLPALPTTIAAGPKVFVPLLLAFYAQ